MSGYGKFSNCGRAACVTCNPPMTHGRSPDDVPRGPDRIYLEPSCAEWSADGRQWCQDNVWPTDDADDCPECKAGGVEYIRADLATLPSVERIRAEAWQPIETAPKDGAILVYSPANKRAFIAEFNPDGTSWVAHENGMSLERVGNFISGGGWFQPDEVTHWMPLPEPPRSLNTGEDVG